MTKQLKKGLLTVLMFVMSLAICFTAVNAFSAKAEASDPDAVAAFETLVDDIESTSYTTALLTDSAWVKSMKVVNKAWGELGDDQAYVSEEAKGIFESALAVFEEPYQIEIYLTSDLYNKLNNVNGAKLYKDDEATYRTMINRYNAAIADVNVETYLNAVPGLTDNIAAADSSFVAIDNAINTAKTKITEIQYANADGSAMDVYAAGTYERIVLGSETSINAVTTALNAIYDTEFAKLENVEAESRYITGYATYTTAVRELADEEEKAADVELEIKNLKDEHGVSVAGQVIWTKKTQIELAEQHYNDLEDSTYNNLKSLVVSQPVLKTYTDRLDAIGGANRDCQTDGEIFNVNAKIIAIGTVAYTTDSFNKIDAARDMFDALDNDINLADEAVGATTYYVEQYPALVQAEKDYKALKDQVDEFKAEVDNMADVVAAGGDVNGEFINVLEPLYGGLNADQIAAIKVDTNTDGKTYFNLYVSYQAQANSIISAAQPVIQLIKEMMNAKANNPSAFADAMAAASAAYNALDDTTKYAVTNRQDLFDVEAELAGATKAWQDAVAAIRNGLEVDESVSPVVVKATIATIEIVKAADDAYLALSDDMKTIITAMTSTATDYNLFAAASGLEVIGGAQWKMLKNIADIAVEMGNLSIKDDIELTDKGLWDVNELDIIEFANAVNAVKAKYNALSDVTDNDQKQYLQDNNLVAFANYQTAVLLNERYNVEAAIAKIYADGVVTITDDIDTGNDETKFLISTAEGLRDAYEGDATDIRNADDLTDARTQYNAITKKLTDWATNVLALMGDKDEVADLVSVALDKVALYDDEYNGTGTFTVAFTTDERAANVKVDGKDYVVSDVYTLLGEIKVQGEAVATTLNNDIAAFLAAHPELTTNDIEAIEELNTSYNSITPSQQALVTNYDAFQGAYSKLNFKTFFGEAVKKLDTEVKAGVYTDEGAIMIDILKSVYAGAGVELQKLAAAEYETLKIVIAAYAGKDVKLTNYATLKEEIQGIIDGLYDGKGDNDIATNAANISTLTTNLGKLTSWLTTYADLVEDLEETFINVTELETALSPIKTNITDITKVGGLLDDAKQAAITAANGYADGLKAQLEKLLYSEEEGKEGDIVKILAELEVLADAIDTLDTKTSEALATAKTELEGKINTLKTELEGKINAEKAEREEADAAIKADLEAAVAKLNKTIVTITVILGVVSLALAGCVVFIFLKKKA